MLLLACDYQSERHCSKTHDNVIRLYISAITSQNGTAPKPEDVFAWIRSVRLPVRTALLQNLRRNMFLIYAVRLPVRTALLQNMAQET